MRWRAIFGLGLAAWCPVQGTFGGGVSEGTPGPSGAGGSVAPVTPVTPVAATLLPATPVPAATEPRVEDFPLSELFRRPIGPRGLEYSDRARTMAGRKVRLTGYQVRQTAPIPFSLLLSPVPVTLHEREYGLAEDLPANTVHVFFPRNPQPVMPWLRGPRSIEGILEIGAREEADGRISHVRLQASAPPAAPGPGPVSASAPGAAAAVAAVVAGRPVGSADVSFPAPAPAPASEFPSEPSPTVTKPILNP